MTPDPATIARRRHFATMLLRAFVLVFALWSCWLFATDLIDMLWAKAIGGALDASSVLRLLFVYGPRVAAVVGLVLFESHLVRWVVPLPSSEPVCPKCGYSTRNLKGPICPECGTSVR